MWPPHLRTSVLTHRPTTGARRVGVFLVALAILGGAFVWSILTFVNMDSAAADLWLTDRLHALRDDRLIAIFAWITGLGTWRAVIAMLAGLTFALMILRRASLVVALWMVFAGNQVAVTWLKAHFDRPRPEFAYFLETSGSFPSGHAAASVAVWGMFCYVAWRIRWLRDIVALLLAAVIALSISFSRLYLGEHYLSDVVSGALLGSIWLTVGVAFSTIFSNRSLASLSARRQSIAKVAAALGLAAALVMASPFATPVNQTASNSPTVGIAQDCGSLIPPTRDWSLLRSTCENRWQGLTGGAIML